MGAKSNAPRTAAREGGRSRLGAWREDRAWAFRVWAPDVRELVLVLEGPDVRRDVPMERGRDGYHTATVRGLAVGARYRYRVDGQGPFPDPCSRSQPDGPHGASALVDPDAFRWSDASWRGVPADRLVIYELHVGTMTPAGTFDALIDRLPDLVQLGVNALELMPLAEAPGRWNWGYDGVSPFAPASAYGGPEGLRRLVDAAHRHGLAVLVDVVYNHLGPDGNYLGCYSRGYFTKKHHTPWGDALNYEAAPVRDYFVSNALHWILEHHVDGLRLDATHEIKDDSRRHVLAEISARVRAAAPDRSLILIAEDDRNEAKLMAPAGRGGWAFDGVWADDLHHQLQVALAKDSDGYYRNYTGTARAIARTLERGWYYEGQRMPVTGKARGTRADRLPPSAFVHCLQNHDQVGNRALGERLHHLIAPAAWRAASTLLLASPYTPLLFMGQEWAASAPFLFFTDHHAELGRQVTEGRRREFGQFRQFKDPKARAKIPDPQSPKTVRSSKLDWEERERRGHAQVLALTTALLRLRAGWEPATRKGIAAGTAGTRGVWLRRSADVLVVLALDGRATVDLAGPGRRPPRGTTWQVALSSEAAEFGGDPRRARLDAKRGRVVLDGPAALVLEAAPR